MWHLAVERSVGKELARMWKKVILFEFDLLSRGASSDCVKLE